ncbi:MAG: hypothetical protein WKF84_12380 [Pyrinomonadaceae bacterium]
MRASNLRLTGRFAGLAAANRFLTSSNSSENPRVPIRREATLTQLEEPAPLYMFLDRANDSEVTAKLIEVLGHIGDARTADLLRAFTSAKNSKIVEASKSAVNVIDERLAHSSEDSVSRPRRTGVAVEKP